MRKRFSCGHHGLGRYCHRCRAQTPVAPVEPAAAHDLAQASSLAQLRERERLSSIGLAAAVHQPAVLERALDVLNRLEQGVHPLALGARCLNSRRGDFSIAIGRRYRLLVDATTLKPVRFMSHETYKGVV